MHSARRLAARALAFLGTAAALNAWSPMTMHIRDYGLVKISGPRSVIATVCSNWADSEPSEVMTVQPSSSKSQWWAPALIIGSIVKTMPGRSFGPGSG